MCDLEQQCLPWFRARVWARWWAAVVLPPWMWPSATAAGRRPRSAAVHPVRRSAVAGPGVPCWPDGMRPPHSGCTTWATSAEASVWPRRRYRRSSCRARPTRARHRNRVHNGSRNGVGKRGCNAVGDDGGGTNTLPKTRRRNTWRERQSKEQRRTRRVRDNGLQLGEGAKRAHLGGIAHVD